MNIEIKLKTEKKVTVDFLEFGYFGSDDTILTMDWDESQYEPGDIYGKGVQINEEYANGRINELMGLELIALQVYDLESEQEMDWIEVESISFFDDDKTYEVMPYYLQRFKRHGIQTDCVNLNLTEEQYQSIARYVRQNDRIENLFEAMENHILQIDGYENVFQFLEKELQDHPKEMTDEFNPVVHTGEAEIDALSDIIENRGGIATYTLISNQGTENECENEVVLMKKQADFWADNIREKNNGSDMLIQEGNIILKDIKGDDVDLFFVDEICFKTDEVL